MFFEEKQQIFSAHKPEALILNDIYLGFGLILCFDVDQEQQHIFSGTVILCCSPIEIQLSGVLDRACLVLDNNQEAVIDFHPDIHEALPFSRPVLHSGDLPSDNDFIYCPDIIIFSPFTEKKSDKILSDHTKRGVILHVGWIRPLYEPREECILGKL